MRPASAVGRARALVECALLTLLGLIALTGLSLSFTYSPSATHAWGSVAFLERAVPCGHFVRALHHDATKLLVALGLAYLCGLAWAGEARERPGRWVGRVACALGVVLLAHTGLLLPADGRAQAAAQELFSITASVPWVGGALTGFLRGGPLYGHLTLVHLNALHTLILPLALGFGLALLLRGRARPLDVPALAAVGAVVAASVAFALWHGAPLWAPGSPARAFPARPEWFLLPIFQLRRHLGAAEAWATVGVPALLVLLALALVRLGRAAARVSVGVTLTAFAGLLFWGLHQDAGDARLRSLRAEATREAQDALRLAAMGMPERGPLFLDRNDPVVYGRHLFAERCAVCHPDASGGRYQGDLLLRGYASRAWLHALLAHPRDPHFFGNGELDMMDPVPAGPRRDAVVEYLLSLSGTATGLDPALVREGRTAYAEDCESCHTVDGKGGAGAPDLLGYGSAAWLSAFLRDPGAQRFYAEDNQMERFGPDRLDEEALRAVVAYVQSRAQEPLNIPSAPPVEGPEMKAEASPP